MAKVNIFFYDEQEKRQRRKRLRGEAISYTIVEDFVKIVVDDKIFLIKKEHVISLDINES